MISCNGKSFQTFISNETIQARLKELAIEINQDYTEKKPLFIGVLNGCFRLTGDLFNYIDIESEISFVKLKSYVGTQSSRNVTTMIGLNENLKGRHLIIVEDIVDTGRTMFQFLQELEKLEPASVTVMALLTKPDALEHDVALKYVGFEVPNLFLIGYGLDYDGLGRHYNDIYQIVE